RPNFLIGIGSWCFVQCIQTLLTVDSLNFIPCAMLLVLSFLVFVTTMELRVAECGPFGMDYTGVIRSLLNETDISYEGTESVDGQCLCAQYNAQR
ncbi:MAG: hypothetical protein U9Q68_10495, partial [Euryarchaeota archaeon]|nr:hypothetical protein [Euryarchaeota archaeon]